MDLKISVWFWNVVALVDLKSIEDSSRHRARFLEPRTSGSVSRRGSTMGCPINLGLGSTIHDFSHNWCPCKGTGSNDVKDYPPIPAPEILEVVLVGRNAASAPVNPIPLWFLVRIILNICLDIDIQARSKRLDLKSEELTGDFMGHYEIFGTVGREAGLDFAMKSYPKGVNEFSRPKAIWRRSQYPSQSCLTRQLLNDEVIYLVRIPEVYTTSESPDRRDRVYVLSLFFANKSRP
ncbi:uncharacterized protein BDR25DRAFT_360031 [Lindgomyces ingoldianus]|uniref:Uncharacterized protein n=1 Tax=Lindgomyces ingoldianus TaxID=673940 RepID=A0ACB6QG54_9PLEO|nr:uncharacterized protein BDR25DRAFT_360031 [Lindgomyces ingoldianus]KAF2465872.1 hypothetical protein BDR25DRAFT_360031 [Lindgomyces ingoldianus]